VILPGSPQPSLRLRIDSEALAANWRTLDRLSGRARAGAAVKADGYGLGAGPVMTALIRAGARDFFVAHWSEVPALLAQASGAQIAVLHGPLLPADVAYAQATGVRPVINSLHQAALWLESGGGPCHLMVDTGINRLGLSPGELGDPLVGRLDVEVLLSHLASADEDGPQNARQLALFHETARVCDARSLSLANSAGIALGPDYAFDLTRPGIALYGGVPRPELAGAVRQVVHLEAAVLQLRDLSPGDKVGYNAAFIAPRAMRAATISIGYADGLLRSWSGNGTMVFAGQALPLIGRVSMDMVMADASEVPELRAGDFVTMPYALPEASHLSGLSQYELLTVLGNRFCRKEY